MLLLLVQSKLLLVEEMCHHLFPHVKSLEHFPLVYFTMTLKACDKTPKRLLAFVESDFEKTKKKKAARRRRRRWCVAMRFVVVEGDEGGDIIIDIIAASSYRSRPKRRRAQRATLTTLGRRRVMVVQKVLQKRDAVAFCRANASDRACVECDSKETTGGSWLRSKTHPGNYPCFNCYSRELSKTSNKQCASSSGKDGQKWYKSKRDGENWRGREVFVSQMLRERTFGADERDKVVLDVFDGRQTGDGVSRRTTRARICVGSVIGRS